MLSGDVRKVLTRITSIAQDHYPETMAETIIINAPVSFRLVWAGIKPLLQPRTQKKITLLGSKYIDELAARVDLKNLPTYLGGECKSTLLEDAGPWNDEATLSRLNHIHELPGAEGLQDEPSESPCETYSDVSSKPNSEKKAAVSGTSDILPAVRSCLPSELNSAILASSAWMV
jgi:hypothetical protein